jgi:hypothetical protein
MSSPDEKPTVMDSKEDDNKLGTKGALHNEKADVEFDTEGGNGARTKLSKELGELRQMSQKLENPLAGKSRDELLSDVDQFVELHGLEEFRKALFPFHS